MKALVIVTILSLQVCSILTTCNQPQTIYHINNGSVFVGYPDIQQGFQEGFSKKLSDIELNSGTFLHQNSYTLSNIVPKITYTSSNQTNTLSTNTINEAGGELEINLEMNFLYVNGLKKSSGSAIGQFPSTFYINLTKTANFNPNDAKNPLQWTCSLNQLNLSNLTFIRQNGSDLDVSTIKIFNELLQNTNKEKYESAVLQIQGRLNQSVNFMASVNNQQVQSLFGSNKDYSYDGQKMTIDESLAGYSLASTGETMQVIGTPVGQDTCLNIQIFNQPVSYIGVSTSFINNTYDFLLSQKYFDIDMNSKEWTIPNFSFQVKDLVFVLPKITTYYSLDEKLGGPCTYESGSAPVFNATGNTFFMNETYSCSLRALTLGELVMTFTVNSQLTLTPGFNNVNQITMIVSDADFFGSNYNPVDKLAPVQNTGLLQYFLDNAAGTIIGMPVYGTGVFNLPTNLTNPQWEMGTDQSTLYFYGSSSSEDNKVQIE